MSDDEFHVHGAHDHAIDHAIKHGAGGGHGEGHHFVSRIAVTTAILSAIGAVASYQAGHTQNEALLLKSEAAILKTAASDQWNTYQAKNVEEKMARLLLPLTPVAEREALNLNIERFSREKMAIKSAAEKLDATAADSERQSQSHLHAHRQLALSTTLMQVAIALSAVALLSRKKWLLYGIYGAAGIGIGFGVMGLLNF